MEPVISGVVDYTISKIVQYILKPLASEVTYVCFINRNFRNLESEVEMLKKTKECVQDKVSSARRNADDIKPVVEKWLSEVDDIIRKYEEMVLVNEGRHGISCSNLVQRHKLSKQARKMVVGVIQLKDEGSFDQVSSPGLLSNQSPPPKIVGFLDFESRVLTMNQIMTELKENHVSRIGVHGMGGVGKTMLVEEILRKIKEEKVFDKVVTLTISQTPDLKLIQGKLADMLDMKLEQETIEGRAHKLQKRLMNEKNILIVFDDIWEPIDLETIGIPRAGCKILFTSRDEHLLSIEMCTDKTFELKVLTENESWKLFETIIDDNFENEKPIAHQIVKSCAHLPIVITTVAKALRKKDISLWADALNQLKNHVAMNIKGMNKKVYSPLKLSYDYLEFEEARLLFLLCSMFPEDFDIPIEELQVYAISMDFLPGVGTIEQKRQRITKLVDDLVSSSLLLQDKYNNHVKMHDILCDVAILISSKHDKIRTLSYVKKRGEEWEEEKVSSNYTAVYVRNQDFHNNLIPKILIPKVQLLTLGTEPHFVKYELVESFFEEMKELKSLELNHAKIPILPSSLTFANVRLLHLLDCELDNIDVIGELKKLQILSFERSNIIQIPSSISQLTELKVLNLSACRYLNVIPPNILSRLTKLEELYLGTFKGWEREEGYEGRKNASLCELKNLPWLYALSLTIQDEKIIPKQKFLGEMNLKKFHIDIGNTRRSCMEYEMTKVVRLKIQSAHCLDDWTISTLLKKSEGLYFQGSISTKTLLLKLDENESPHLKHLRLCDNLEIKQYLIDEETKRLQKILSNLERIQLCNVKNLESIVHGYDRESTFHKLRTITVMECNELRNLFFKCTSDDILNLDEIHIYSCPKMEVLFVIEDEDSTNQIEFTHLKFLRLHYGYFPQLQKFCSKIENPETSTISNDDSFFSEQVSLPNLEFLSIDGADNLRMIWPNILIPNSFSKLTKVCISSCQSLEKVFPSQIISILSSLDTLYVKDCNLLQGIFEVQDLNITESNVVIRSNLRYLELHSLPNLEYVWSKDPYKLQIFPNLRDLSIKECPKLRRAYLLKQSKSLQIDLGEFKEIFEKAKTTQIKEGSRWFSNLKSLTLFGCLDHKLNQLPMEVVQILHNLINFEVRSTFIEEIFPTKGLINAEEYENETSMALKKLCLFEMPKLTCIWKESSHNNILSFQSLQLLEISRCSQLKTLLPSSMSFKSLSNLTIYECHRLTHLLDPSVARALVQLKNLSLRSCKNMITVIADGGEEENYEIVFNNLRNLSLARFFKLTNFYSGRRIIRFPCLDKVSVEDCPEMKIFSQTIVATPASQLLKVNLEEFFVKDINTIFQKLWEDNNDVASIQRLFVEENLEEAQYDL